MKFRFSVNEVYELTHLHVDGLHVVADEVAELLIPAVAAILPPVAHLGVVDAGGVAASPIQLGVAVGANTLQFGQS